jgi:hypothetical protein
MMSALIIPWYHIWCDTKITQIPEDQTPGTGQCLYEKENKLSASPKTVRKVKLVIRGTINAVGLAERKAG